ncbi:hypothetical protein HPT27_09935 [Permianibacter sp. IMCC34836]|uniref:protein YgfX n=1 Tax=Permianibacter fluminis TaxID=2738515 RepID=UPI001557485F|nr:protein YgfX [Permianibacter fluminis]NQD37348.1 hypothetical protein [Permianibacter fluminis]
MTDQKKNTETQRFLLQAAPRWRLLNVLFHLLIAALVLIALPPLYHSATGWWWSLLLLSLFLLGLILFNNGWRIDGQLGLRQRTAIRVLQHDAEGWAVGVDVDRMQAVQLRAGTFVASSFVVLNWRLAEASSVRFWRRRGNLLLTPDMLGPEQYRRLCRQLWQHQADAP